MSDESRAAISARLLAAPPEPQRRETAPARGAIVVTAVAATVAVVIAVVIVPTVRRGAAPEEQARAAPAPASTPHTSRASIRAIGNARFFRAQPPPDEIVRLDDGRIELDVIPLAAGERFRVVTDHGEVEVRGTIFEVLASNRSLRSVSVSRGRVEVRSGSGLSVLDAGDRWSRRRRRPVRRPAPPRLRPHVTCRSRSHARTSARPRPRARCSIAPGRRCARATPAMRPHVRRPRTPRPGPCHRRGRALLAGGLRRAHQGQRIRGTVVPRVPAAVSGLIPAG